MRSNLFAGLLSLALVACGDDAATGTGTATGTKTGAYGKGGGKTGPPTRELPHEDVIQRLTHETLVGLADRRWVTGLAVGTREDQQVVAVSSHWLVQGEEATWLEIFGQDSQGTWSRTWEYASPEYAQITDLWFQGTAFHAAVEGMLGQEGETWKVSPSDTGWTVASMGVVSRSTGLQADMDGDGKLETYEPVTAGEPSRTWVEQIRTTDDPKNPLVRVSLFEVFDRATKLCKGDLDGDGRLELIVVRPKDGVRVAWIEDGFWMVAHLEKGFASSKGYGTCAFMTDDKGQGTVLVSFDQPPELRRYRSTGPLRSPGAGGVPAPGAVSSPTVPPTTP